MLQLVARTTYPAVCFPISRKKGIFKIRNVSINTSQISWMLPMFVVIEFKLSTCPSLPSQSQPLEHSQNLQALKQFSGAHGWFPAYNRHPAASKNDLESQCHRNPWIWGLLCHFRKRQNILIFGCLRTSKTLADSMFPAFISLDFFPKISLMVQAAYHFHWSRNTTCHWSLPSHLKTMRCIWSTIASLHAN